MNSTLTIRLDDSQRRKLTQAASRAGKSDSEWVRQVIERSLNKSSLASRVGHLRGRLAETVENSGSFAESIREHNWRS